MNWSLSFGRQEWDGGRAAVVHRAGGRGSAEAGWMAAAADTRAGFQRAGRKPAPLEERLRAWLAGQLE